MTLDTTARNLADRLIDKFGKTVVIRRTTRTAYDGAAGTGGDENAPVNYTVKVTPPTDFMFKRIDGTLVEEGDEVVSVAALNLAITPDATIDVVIQDTVLWRIRQVGRLWSGELVATYILHLRK